MSTVIFYEKPGCGNNTRQKIWLASSGHTVLAKNLLTENWTEVRLRPFFGDLPVAQWFNPSAPKIKSGTIDPAKLDGLTALDMMIVEPLLIRRPLMEVEGVFCAGFDAKAVDAWIGLNDTRSKEEEASPPCTHSEPCRPPELLT